MFALKLTWLQESSSKSLPMHLPLAVLLTRSLFPHSAQRNVYLTGFTLFLSLVLTRVFYISLDLIHVTEEYKKQQVQVRPIHCFDLGYVAHALFCRSFPATQAARPLTAKPRTPR